MDLSYNVMGQEIERRLPGGITSTMQYDLAGRPDVHRVTRQRGNGQTVMQ